MRQYCNMKVKCKFPSCLQKLLVNLFARTRNLFIKGEQCELTIKPIISMFLIIVTFLPIKDCYSGSQQEYRADIEPMPQQSRSVLKTRAHISSSKWRVPVLKNVKTQLVSLFLKHTVNVVVLKGSLTKLNAIVLSKQHFFLSNAYLSLSNNYKLTFTDESEGLRRSSASFC